MIIHEQEIKDGLRDQILAKSSISIASAAQSLNDQSIINNKKLKALASYNDNDLYYVQSILVTSSWNKNDDIFDKAEIWNAKNTPEDKPTNLEHDESLIIGHIISNWAITDDGILIDENTPIENLPDKFHILTGSVIYKSYIDPNLKERTEKLISSIENGTKYVSMECMFKGFDYGLINENTGEFKVLARSDDTAFLTKHLRSYGGTGVYDNHKIGRVLRNITFSGKGYVDKPANPDSIIFSKDNFLSLANEKKYKNNFLGVSEIRINQMEINNMSLEKEMAELKEKVQAMADCASSSEQASAQIAELKEKISILETSMVSKDTELTANKAAYEELVNLSEAAKKMSEEEMMKKEEEMKKAKSELDQALEVIAAYKNKEEEMMKKEKRMKRMASLLEKGLDRDFVNQTVDKFDSLEDEAFAAVVEAITQATSIKVSEKTESVQVADEVLDSAEPVNEVNLSVSESVESSENTTRAALVDFVYARLGKKLNKGE